MPRCCVFVLLLLVAIGACSPPRHYNDPAAPDYDPNYPVRRRPAYLPAEHDGFQALYRDETMSIFVVQWRDPAAFLARVRAAIDAEMPGYEQIRARYLDRPIEHSVQGLVDDELVGLDVELFLARGVVLTVTEGFFRVTYADGSSELDHGVRLDMSGGEKKSDRMRRSRAGSPLELQRGLRRPDRGSLRVMLLMPRDHLDRTVASIEPVSPMGVGGEQRYP